jgi:hypothetical protein
MDVCHLVPCDAGQGCCPIVAIMLPYCCPNFARMVPQYCSNIALILPQCGFSRNLSGGCKDSGSPLSTSRFPEVPEHLKLKETFAVSWLVPYSPGRAVANHLDSA